MNIETMLYEEIENRFNELSEIKADAKEYVALNDSVNKLLDRVIEMERIDKDAEYKEKQLNEERKSQYIKSGIDIGSVLLSAGITIGGMLVILTFEEKGTITSGFGKKVVDWIARKK